MIPVANIYESLHLLQDVEQEVFFRNFMLPGGDSIFLYYNTTCGLSAVTIYVMSIIKNK